MSKENGVTPLARQEQLGGLQLARNSRASVPSPPSHESAACASVPSHDKTFSRQSSSRGGISIALQKDRERYMQRQIKKGGVKKEEMSYYGNQSPPIGSIIRATVKYKASSELAQQ